MLVQIAEDCRHTYTNPYANTPLCFKYLLSHTYTPMFIINHSVIIELVCNITLPDTLAKVGVNES